jgi:DNA-binding transcriptional LysR family regulator
VNVTIKQLQAFVAVANSGSFAESVVDMVREGRVELGGGQMREMGAQCRPVIAPVITRNVGMITRKRRPRSVATEAMMVVIRQWTNAGESRR